MQHNEYNKQHNNDEKSPQPPKRREITPEESATRHIILSLVVVFVTLNVMLQLPFTNMVDILDQEYAYPYNENNLYERRKDHDTNENLVPHNQGEHHEHNHGRHNSNIDPLDEMVSNYQLTPHIKVNANEYSGVDKATTNYVWQILKIDDALTSQVANRIIVYQNQDYQNGKEELSDIDGLIAAYKEELYEIAMPENINEHTKSSLIFARESLLKRHENLKDAFEIVVDDPKDTSGKAKDLVKEIVTERDNAANNLVNALRSSKKF